MLRKYHKIVEYAKSTEIEQLIFTTFFKVSIPFQ